MKKRKKVMEVKPNHDTSTDQLPDVANDSFDKTQDISSPLQKVGMENVDLPILLETDNNTPITIPAKADFFVNLSQEKVRGIHMSRLYINAQKTLSEIALTPQTIKNLLKSFVESHKGLSEKSFAEFRFNHLVYRKALLSENKGWLSYPIKLKGQLNRDSFSLELHLQVAYSSTCPCSASLARQIIQKNFQETFSNDLIDAEEIVDWLGSEKGINATPHSQRSLADVTLQFKDELDNIDLESWIDLIESSLKTPVQGPVKREDEQEFARLNGENPMFCEDAARRIKKSLEAQVSLNDYRIHVQHLESLHPFDAVAVAVKGVEGGMKE